MYSTMGLSNTLHTQYLTHLVQVNCIWFSLRIVC